MSSRLDDEVIRRSLGDGFFAILPFIAQGDIIVESDNKNIFAQDDMRFTNLRESLEFLAQLDSEEAAQDSEEGEEEGEDEPHLTIDQQFQDVMTYHEQKRERLRAALQS